MSELTIQQNFELALRHHQAGRLGEAEQLYRRVLAERPDHALAMLNLGAIALQVGQPEPAVDLIRRAIVLHPELVEAHGMLGNALFATGRLEEAAEAYRRAIALRPELADAHGNLGVVLKAQGTRDAAIASYQRAIALRPDHADALSNLGEALREAGRLQEAVSACRRAIAARPDHAEAQNNLGAALQEMGELEEAAAAFRRAIALKGEFALAHRNLGNTLRAQGRLEQAMGALERAIALRPDDAEAHNILGVALEADGRLDDAIAAFQRAISIRPDNADALGNLANAMRDSGQLELAIPAYLQALSLCPGDAAIHSNLVFAMQVDPRFDARAIAAEAARWDAQHAEPLRKFIPVHVQARDTNRRLRIGYVSPDFRDHVVGRNILPIFRNHDRSGFEIFCYSNVLNPDARTREFQQRADGWRSIVGASDEQAARQIREDRIDILVDLALHTANNRLLIFARKPAPVQACFAGYPGSTGVKAIDYRLSDPFLDPVGMDESIHSEKTIRLPHSFWCYDPLDNSDIPVSPVPAIENGFVTFGCLNNFSKLNEDALSRWAAVLKEVNGSRLILLAGVGSHRRRTHERLARDGVDPGRIEFVARLNRREYLQTYHRIDIGLDTFPYNGHTTSLDSLWMGVPVVTRVGETAVSRAGLCQLSNLGLAELAVETDEEFVRVAVQLAGDVPKLAELRAGLRRRMEQSPLMDAVKFTRSIEAAYRRMWEGQRIA